MLVTAYKVPQKVITFFHILFNFHHINSGNYSTFNHKRATAAKCRESHHRSEPFLRQAHFLRLYSCVWVLPPFPEWGIYRTSRRTAGDSGNLILDWSSQRGNGVRMECRGKNSHWEKGSSREESTERKRIADSECVSPEILQEFAHQ
jgi:hypothetical protein